MLFSSLIFICVFLPVIIFLYYCIFQDRRKRNALLTFASLFFYAWGEPSFVLIMFFSIVINWLLGLAVSGKSDEEDNSFQCRVILGLAVIANLSLLAYYKYFNFFLQNLNFFMGLQLPYRDIVLPIGISFFTFQGMSYVFDIYRGNGEAQKNLWDVALYIAFFPQLIAGPIVRYETVAIQIRKREESMQMFSGGAKRFLEGLAKKVLLSNTLAVIADKVFQSADYSELSIGFAWLGAISYSLQIYYDFSGYSDMAIGLGKMFGFKFLENFNYPYISASVSEFWRRWHISLGTWFRDYVYFPLGGSRVSTKKRLFLNLLIVWLLTGIWHGASWNFVMWGLLHFLFITFEKFTNIPHKLNSVWLRCMYRVLTLLVVIFGWVLFRVPGMRNAMVYIKTMLGCYGNPLVDLNAMLYLRENIILLLLAVVFSMPIIPCIHRWADKTINIPSVKYVAQIAYYSCLLVLFLISVSTLVKGSYNPFIYFNF